MKHRALPSPLAGNTCNALLGNPDDGELALQFQMQVMFEEGNGE